MKIFCKFSWKRIEAICDGWGKPSKIFWVAKVASEKIWTWVISKWDLMKQLMVNGA